MQFVNGLRFNNLRGDLFGGLTAAVVALPLALAFGVASGAGPMAGLYGAIFVGFFAALFGGTPAQVSGPTGPMTVVMAAVFTHYGDAPALAFTVVVLGGAVQILFGILRLGRYVTYVPFSVISGFMSGIGCIIVILELAPFLGLPASQQGPLAALVALPATFAGAGRDAVALGVLALAIVLFMPRRVARLLPPPLAALVVGTLAGLAFFHDAPVIGAIPHGLPHFIPPTFGLDAIPGMVRSALVLGLLGSIDSLLTSLIADNITRSHHLSDRELIGQGIGNMIAGLFGGIAGAGATMRTVINVRAGGRTPLSGAIHALTLLALVLGLSPLAESIPHAVLAGILLKVGWDIIDWGYLKRLRQAPRDGVTVMLVVLSLTVAVDLITAVGVGIIMSALITSRRLSDHQLSQLRVVSSDKDEASLNEEERALMRSGNGAILLLHLTGPFSFASAKDLVRRVSPIQGHRVVVYDVSDVSHIDTSIAMAIDELIRQEAEAGRAVLLAGLDSGGAEVLRRLKVLDQLPAGHRFRHRLEALRAAAALAAPVSEAGRGTQEAAG